MDKDQLKLVKSRLDLLTWPSKKMNQYQRVMEDAALLGVVGVAERAGNMLLEEIADSDRRRD